ncbi:MAG: antibiotic biosynthesis monooxygenase [Chloroflexi bacterium]|uniref:Antibiotic biosynthesis monooxygenase n=1 Tax=Candidatus Chlorohelix allophototropha TaxID=3003348 RepID=A0A8T7M7H0_9CHLR|nr:antibiotic biosynthesis monooxygenase [Chloroflexota bacterium]WJW68038.1 antibiotic biosynthesis monooxygenase [Chloroflexota bacterium L227-S17]
MICLAVTYIIKPGHENEAINLLKIMTELTREEPGNLLYIAHRSPTQPNRFFLYEQYTEQAAVDAHRASPHFQQYVIGGLFNILESRTPESYEPI